MKYTQSLTIALVVSVSVALLEFVGGSILGSVALRADAFHVVTDVFAISLSIGALWASSRPPQGELTYGYHRFEVLASLVGGVSLFGIALYVVYEAYSKFFSAQQFNVNGTIVLGLLAAGLNVFSSSLINPTLGQQVDLNLASTRYHMFADGLSSLSVVLGATLVHFTGIKIIDPIVAIIIAGVITLNAFSIIRQSGSIILEKSPIENLEMFRKDLARIVGINDVHDLHVWRICSHITVASMHVRVDPGLRDTNSVRSRLEDVIRAYGIQHLTVQIEDAGCTQTHGHQ